MPDTMISPMTVLREAIRAVPAVKWALGVGGISAAVALVYLFRIDPRVAFVGIIITLIFMGVLVIFARASALGNAAIRLPALVFTWFVLLLFMANAISLFTSVFFSKPLDLQYWLTGTQKAAAAPVPQVPNADSGWIGGGSSPSGYCDPIFADLRNKYANYKVQMTLLPEQHRSEYSPFKHDYYRYQCSFSLTEK